MRGYRGPGRYMVRGGKGGGEGTETLVDIVIWEVLREGGNIQRPW